MRDWIDSKYLTMRTRMQRFTEEFVNGEMGVSSFVATILLIVIVVALCALFWTNISQWFNDMWIKITGDASKIGNS